MVRAAVVCALTCAARGVECITCGVDTQDNRLALQLVGWERLTHFSAQLGRFYFAGLVSEVYNPAKNRFEKRRGVRNEPLDTQGARRCRRAHKGRDESRPYKIRASGASAAQPPGAQPVAGAAMSVLRQRDAGFFRNQGFQPLVEGRAFTFSGGETGAVRDGADARANVAAGWFIRRLAHFSAGFQIIINQVAGIAAKTPQAKAGTIFAHQFCRQCRQNLLAVTCALPAQHFGADALPHAPVRAW